MNDSSQKYGVKKVVILQHRLLHYRVKLFDELKYELKHNNIELDLISGGASSQEKERDDVGRLAWNKEVKNIFFRVGRIDILWQCLPWSIFKSDLIIIMQENRIVSNYYVMALCWLLNIKVAYWGHGKNLQSVSPRGFREKWKRYCLNKVDWWFAYTSSTVQYLVSKGYPVSRTTCLNNAIDTDDFKRSLAQVSEEQLIELRGRLGVNENSHVGLFCGSLYKEKRLKFLVQAVDLIRQSIPDFHLVVVGSGSYLSEMRRMSQTRNWIKLVGVQKGEQKALYYRLAGIVLNPGLVGLHVLDSFCAGLPMVTTSDALHSPEFDYLRHGVNGLILPGEISEYAAGVVSLMSDSELYLSMCGHSFADSDQYTSESMAVNFCRGILQCTDR